MEPPKKPPIDISDIPASWYWDKVKSFSGRCLSYYRALLPIIAASFAFAGRGLFSYRALLAIIAASLVLQNMQEAEVVFVKEKPQRVDFDLQGVESQIEKLNITVNDLRNSLTDIARVICSANGQVFSSDGCSQANPRSHHGDRDRPEVERWPH